MLTILAHGTLIEDPVEQRGTNETSYATCVMRVSDDDGEPVLVSVVSFDPAAAAALLRLRRGAACGVVGRARIMSRSVEGAEQTGLSIVADRVL